MLTSQQVSGWLEKQKPFLLYPGVRPPYVSSIFCSDCQAQWFTLRCCRSVWCPICNWKLAVRMSDYLKQLRSMLSSNYKALMITLTFKNIERMSMYTFTDYRHTFRKKFLRSGKIKKLILGGFYSFDWTVSKTCYDQPFNIHIHLLAFSKAYIPFHILKTQWHKATGDSEVVWISDVQNLDKAMHEVCNYIEQTEKLSNCRPDKREELMKSIQGMRRFSKFGIAYKIKLPRKKGRCAKCKGHSFQLHNF